MKNTITVLIALIYISLSQEIYTGYIIENTDTLDVFSYQIPSGYLDSNEHPILVAFHQWGGNQDSPYSTSFDEEAELRNWIFLSPFGGSSNNYNHQEAQRYVELAILFLNENFSIDQNRIYMVGGSMGGASGSIYANNHLNPKKPMVAATASASGILDCERRAIEMDGNNSMTEWFGGNWDEVPFEYHRNSAVYFADPTQSMHYNLQNTPLYLDFGITEPHRTHAEDLHNLLQGYNQNIWIDTEPTGSHGFSVIDENHACNWLSQYELVDDPDIINVNLDEPSRAYWIEAYNQFNNDDFIRINATRNETHYEIENVTNTDSLVLFNLNNEIESFSISIQDSIYLGLTGSILNYNYGYLNIEVSCPTFNDSCTAPFTYEIINSIIWLDNECFNNSNLTSTDLGCNIVFEVDAYNDVNLDGIWNISDIIILIEFIINNQSPDNTNPLNGNMNLDSIVDILDIILIINMILED